LRVAASFALCACQLFAFKMACSQTVRAHKRSSIAVCLPQFEFCFLDAHDLQRHDWLSYSTQLDQGTSIQLAIARDRRAPLPHTRGVDDMPILY
jgi:hypothetical protein